MYLRSDEDQVATRAKVQRDERIPTRVLLLAGLVVTATILVIGIVLARGGDGTGSGEFGPDAVTPQQQLQRYEAVLDARARLDRLREIGASPALVTGAFDELDAVQAAAGESLAGETGYIQFLERRLADELAALRPARAEGLASPAAVQAIQRNIANVRAEQARIAQLG